MRRFTPLAQTDVRGITAVRFRDETTGEVFTVLGLQIVDGLDMTMPEAVEHVRARSLVDQRETVRSPDLRLGDVIHPETHRETWISGPVVEITDASVTITCRDHGDRPFTWWHTPDHLWRRRIEAA